MRIEVLTWAEIIALPDARSDGYFESTGVNWDIQVEEEFVKECPDRIVALRDLHLDEDNEYNTECGFVPEILVKRIIPDEPDYGTHRILKLAHHVH